MLPVPVMTQVPTQVPQPPTGGRPVRIGSSEKRRSKIPVMTESAKNRPNSKTDVSRVLKKNINSMNSSKISESVPSSTTRTLRTNRTSEPSTNPRQNSVGIQIRADVTRRYPNRIRNPPLKHKDYVKH